MSVMARMPGWGVVKGMATTLVRLFQPKVTVQYPEVRLDGAPKGRGRLVLLYDEYGALKCETCFQCAMACPIEVIDMGGVDTKGRYHIHWGPAETYGERREESALRRSGRTVPDRAFAAWQGIDLAPLEPILRDADYSPRNMLTILERTQEAYGHLPVAAIQHISHSTGAWYSEIYGIASSFPNLRFEVPTGHTVGVCRCPNCTLMGGGRIRDALEDALGTELGGVSPDGAVRLAADDCHGDSGTEPYVTLDGERQNGVSPEWAVRLAARLRGAASEGAPARG